MDVCFKHGIGPVVLAAVLGGEMWRSLAGVVRGTCLNRQQGRHVDGFCKLRRAG